VKLSDINPVVLYEATLPSTGKKVKYRPFNVKEERALLTAQVSEDVSVMLNTLSNVISSCVEPKQGLTPFDLEYMFLQVRSKSVGEDSSLVFTCGCGKETTVLFDIRKATVNIPKKEEMNLKLSSDMIFTMKYPLMDELTAIADEQDAEKKLILSIAASVDTVYYKETAIRVKDGDTEELIDLIINKLNGRQFDQLEKFIGAIPTVSLVVPWKCASCGKENSTTLEGIADFF